MYLGLRLLGSEGLSPWLSSSVWFLVGNGGMDLYGSPYL